jgi:hypothetical protein
MVEETNARQRAGEIEIKEKTVKMNRIMMADLIIISSWTRSKGRGSRRSQA